MKSLIIYPVVHHTNYTSPCSTLSVINKYRIFICLVRLLLEAFPFLYRRIELLLSWNKTLSKTPYPWAYIKYRFQQISGIKSSSPTSPVSVELRVTSFCFVELTMGNMRPKDNPPPEFPHMLGWTENYASTQHFKITLLLALRISSIVRVPLMYLIIWPILSRLSRSGARTLVVRNVAAVQVYGLARLVT